MEFRCEVLCNFASHTDSEPDDFRDKCHLQLATLETRPLFSKTVFFMGKENSPIYFFLDKNIHTIA